MVDTEHKRLFEVFLLSNAKLKNSRIITKDSLAKIKSHLENGEKIDANLKKRLLQNKFILITLTEEEGQVVCVRSKQCKVCIL